MTVKSPFRNRAKAFGLLAASLATFWMATPAAHAMQANPASVPARASAVVTRLRVDGAWVRAAPPGAMMLAGYMVLHNDGDAPVRLVSVQSDAFGTVELHRSLVVNGMETMRPAGEQTIAAGGRMDIRPGGLHLMLMQPRQPLKVGDKVRFHLRFADDSMIEVIASVSAEAPGIAKP